VLAHPVRVAVLELLEQGIASPKELSARLDIPLGTLSYHVRVLAEVGMIRLAKKTPRRGAVEHHYRLAEERPSASGWADLPPSARRRTSRVAIEKLGRAVRECDLSAAESRVTMRTLTLDDQGVAELAVELDRFATRLENVVAKSARRLEQGGEGRTVVAAEVLLPS
jgi:DNA-binding transcriptional ArsR family regulator